jgi:hypothetical protein
MTAKEIADAEQLVREVLDELARVRYPDKIDELNQSALATIHAAAEAGH